MIFLKHLPYLPKRPNPLIRKPHEQQYFLRIVHYNHRHRYFNTATDL